MNVLVLTHRLPYAPNRGDRIRAYHLVRLLARHMDVHVVSLVHDRNEREAAASLRATGINVSTALVPRLRNVIRAAAALPTARPLTHVLLDSPQMKPALEQAVRRRRPDAVLAYCSGVAPFALARPLAGIPFVLDLVDVDSAKWSAFSESASMMRRWIYDREARCLGAFEARAARAAVATTVVNDREAELVRRLAPEAEIHVVANGVDAESLRAIGAPTDDPQVIFTGVFDYAPNVEGALWFARHVWPAVRAAQPRAHLVLAGSSPAAAVRRLRHADPSIEITGAVPDMRSYLWRSAIAIAPIFQARGIQNKVLEAAAAGLPCVVTPAVWHGLPDEALPACLVAATSEEFASAVVNLLSMTPGARRALASSAPLAALSWEKRLTPLINLIARAANRDLVARAG
jgi:sugar transferase (PEP-CTERM/EpsH1 system associated)